MNKIGLLVMSGPLILLSAASSFSQEPGVTCKEVNALRAKVERLEKTIENQNSPASKPAGEKHWYDKID
ncbi:MAG TPA: hypothetical protein EYP06_06345, partial [Desulfobacterales bacterium]|nr:hypothetical protein [Desulfobacterales bacterium]